MLFFWSSAETIAQSVPEIRNKMQKPFSPIAGTKLSYDFSRISEKQH